MNNLNNRLIYLDLLRILAVISMILLHVASIEWYGSNSDTFVWLVSNTYNSIVRFCVPIFVMISGALFLNTQKEYSIGHLFKKNILRIVTAFIIWSFLYALYYSGLGRDGGFEFITIKKFIKAFIYGHFHLWFLYMIVGIYLIIPFLKKITQNISLTKYFLILWFVFTLIFNNLRHISLLKEYIENIDKMLQLHFVLGYSGFFILGHYVNTSNFSKNIKSIIYILGICSIIATIFITNYSGKYYTFPFHDYLLPTTCLSSAAIFLFFKDYFSKISFSERFTKIIILISNYSFGIYLVHVFALHLVTYFIPIKSFCPIFSIPIITLIVSIVSFLCVFVIDKIPFFRKYAI